MANGMATMMADSNGNCDGQWWRRWQWPMARVTVTAMADSNMTEMAAAMADSNRNSNGWRQRQQQWQWAIVMATATELAMATDMATAMAMATATARATYMEEGLPLHVAAMCSAIGGSTPCLHPHGHKGKCIHQHCITVVTLLRIFAPPQGGVFLTAHHGLFFVYFLQLLLVYWTTLCTPPALFRHSRTLSARWCSTSSTPPRTPSAYWQSTSAPIALFVKVSPGRACNDYNLNFLCWCEMTNLSATFFISQTFALTLTGNTFVILKTPCCDSWDIQCQSLSHSFKGFSYTTLLPGLGACICLATF